MVDRAAKSGRFGKYICAIFSQLDVGANFWAVTQKGDTYITITLLYVLNYKHCATINYMIDANQQLLQGQP